MTAADPAPRPVEADADDPGWRLFRDWCLATGRCPMPSDRATIQEFLNRFPAAAATVDRRRRAIRRAHRHRGYADPTISAVPEVEPDPRLPAMLRAAPVRGWPCAVPGRRDAFLAVLRWQVGMSRPALARLDADTVLRSLTLTGPGPEPGGCPRCGLTRWLRLLAVAHRNGWMQVRRQLAGQFPSTAADESAHDCARPLRDCWSAMPLLPAIDRHGNVDVTGPISGRAITAATGRRVHQPPVAQGSASPGPSPSAPRSRPASRWERAKTVRDMHWLDERLDELDRRIVKLDLAIRTAYDGRPGVG